MHTRKDLTHVPRPPPVLVLPNEKGEFEVRVNNTQRMLIGTFPSRAMADLFIELIAGLCGPNGCSCGDMESHLAAA